MDNLSAGWFNPTILGVLLLVLLGIFLITKKIINLASTYFADLIKQRDVQHEAHITAWKSLVTESSEVHTAVTDAQNAHEVRASARHTAVMDAVEGQVERSQERHVEIMETMKGITVSA